MTTDEIASNASKLINDLKANQNVDHMTKLMEDLTKIQVPEEPVAVTLPSPRMRKSASETK